MSTTAAPVREVRQRRATRRIEESLLRRARAGSARDATRDAIALVDGARDFSYATLAAHARRFADTLTHAGVAPGDRVALHLDKTAESVVALYGAWLAGAVAVPVNESLRSRQVEHIVRHSESRVLVSSPRRLRLLDAAATAGLPLLEVTLEQVPAAFDDAGVLAGGDVVEPDPAGRSGGAEPAAILYTSGSTGQPRGILLSHENLLSGAEIVAEFLSLRSDDRILSVLPFSFDYGLNQLLAAVEAGATLCLMRSHLPADICRTLARQRITGLAGVPTLWIQLMQEHSPLPRMQLPHLRYITNTGGVLPPALVARYRAQFPDVRLFLMYGLTEAFRSTFLPPDEVDRRPDSIGKAIPRTDILVRDEHGAECPPGVPGELVHRGPTVALGYFRDPVATARVFRADPDAPGAARVVYSGDLVRRDAEGFLYFVGRRDQLIKRLGHRLSPDEIESVVHASGLVAEVVAAGVPDPVAGQAVALHVVPRDAATFSPDVLLSYCRQEMPGYMQPSTITTHALFPRTPSGKIDRQRVTAVSA